MSTIIPDLWPDDIAAPDQIHTPFRIINYQMQQLWLRTKGAFEIDLVSTGSVEQQTYAFDIIAPVLGFRHRLFRARHRVQFVYPVDVQRDGWPEERRAATAEEFMDLLRGIFHDRETKSVILSLLALSNERSDRMGYVRRAP